MDEQFLAAVHNLLSSAYTAVSVTETSSAIRQLERAADRMEQTLRDWQADHAQDASKKSDARKASKKT